MTFGFVENSWPTAITAGHGSVVLILGQAIRQTVADKNRFQVDVGLFVAENLRCEHWDVVAGVGLSCDVEVLVCVFGELFEEESQESVDVLAGGDRIADRASTVGEADIDRLVEEDD